MAHNSVIQVFSKKRRLLVGVFFILFLPVGALANETRLAELAESDTWLRLVHYKSALFSKYKSQADSPLFFMAADGKKNPYGELIATHQGFTQPVSHYSDINLHPICRFPARLRWLTQEGLIDTESLPKPDCERYKNYRMKAQAESVALVFSSYYLNNPSSLFGHTFLRLVKKHDRRVVDSSKSDLLDVAVNYAAQATSTNPIVYSVLGIFGGFRGNFTLMPYYYKVREYNDFESRDLWSYHLNLTRAEVDQLIDHMWELDYGGFKYYFFDENCSYHMLTAIEAAAPRLQILKHLNSGWSIPADTIKAVAKVSGLVKSIDYRPSIYTKYQARVQSLSSAEHELYGEVIGARGVESLADVQEEQAKANVLDAAIAHHQMATARDLLDKSKVFSDYQKQLLRVRARVQIPAQDVMVKMPEEERPDLGHSSRRIQIGFGNSRSQFSFMQLGLRFAFHDLLDRSVGYPKNVRLEIFEPTLRYYFKRNAVELENFSLVRVSSLNALSTFNRSASWQAEIRYQKFYDLNCFFCDGATLNYYYGYSFSLGRLLVTGFAASQFQYASDFAQSNLRVGLGPRLQLYLPLTKTLKFLTTASYRYLPFSRFKDHYDVDFEARYSLAENFAIGAFASLQKRRRQFTVKSFYYF